MNNKGVVGEVFLVIAAVVIFGNVVLSSVNFRVEKQEGGSLEHKFGFTELSKQNGRTIWCKMQNKGAEYCDSLRKGESE